MSMDKTRDAATGMLTRQAFLEEVREQRSITCKRQRRGSLLILQFPALRLALAQHSHGKDAGKLADSALIHLLRVIGARLRSRDRLGRISCHSLCILLKGCREADAVVVAEQYVSMLENIVLQMGKQELRIDIRYRIFSLDARGKRPRQGVSRMVAAEPRLKRPDLIKQVEIFDNTIDFNLSNVVTFKVQYNDQAKLTPVRNVTATIIPLGGNTEQAVNKNVRPTPSPIDSDKRVCGWRMRPGMLLQRKPLQCCFRLQPLVGEDAAVPLQNSEHFATALTALSMVNSDTRPIVESQLVLPIQASQIGADFPEIASSLCSSMRVAPSDICLSMTMESLSKQLQQVAPVLRELNRRGIRLMLERVGSESQFLMMQEVAHFDYLYISGRALNDSVSRLASRIQLEAIIALARQQDSEICSGGVDTLELANHAVALRVEIGFGRDCGPSTPLPEKAWATAKNLPFP